MDKNKSFSPTDTCDFEQYKAVLDFAEIAFIDDENYPRLVYSPIESWVLESPHTAKLEVDATFSFLNTILNLLRLVPPILSRQSFYQHKW